jgi:colicin import membrane protein
VHLTAVAEIAFAVSAIVAGASLIAAFVDRAPRRALRVLAIVLAAVAVALWIAYGLKRHTPIAVSAAGVTLAAVAELAAIRAAVLFQRLRRIDARFDSELTRVSSVIARATSERAAELETTLARARADSASLLAEQERRMAEERRRAAEEREREAAGDLSRALAAAQQKVDSRLQAWLGDLERQRHAVAEQLAQLGERQRQLIGEAEARIVADAERLEAESEQQRAGLRRLRDELARVIQEAVTTGNAELETYAAERRRALHELSDRIRRRERSLTEQIDREETEAVARIQSTFADVERRQVEQLQRVLDRATTSYSEAASQQFADTVRASREAAATRLSRELDRAVQSFAREAERVLAERLAHVGDIGAQRLDKRLTQIVAGLDRQRVEAISTFEQRLLGAEQELRQRIEALGADAEAERAVLEARLHDLARRIDETIARA